MVRKGSLVLIACTHDLPIGYALAGLTGGRTVDDRIRSAHCRRHVARGPATAAAGLLPLDAAGREESRVWLTAQAAVEPELAAATHDWPGAYEISRVTL